MKPRINTATSAPTQLTANGIFDFAFYKIKEAMQRGGTEPTTAALEIKDDKLYAVEFHSKSKHSIVLFSPASDLTETENKNLGDNTVPVERLLVQLKTLQEENKNRIFFIPLAESKKRKHWTGLIIHGNHAYFFDPKGSASKFVYSLEPLKSALENKNITLQNKSFSAYQGFWDHDNCGYFVGALFGEYATSIATAERDSLDELKITRDPKTPKPTAEILKTEFQTIHAQSDNPTASYKVIKENTSIQTKRGQGEELEPNKQDEIFTLEDDEESFLSPLTDSPAPKKSFINYYKKASLKKKIALGIVIGLCILGMGYLTGGLIFAGITGMGIGYALTTIATSSIAASASIGGGVAVGVPVGVAAVIQCSTSRIQRNIGGLDNNTPPSSPHSANATTSPSSSPTPETGCHNDSEGSRHTNRPH